MGLILLLLAVALVSLLAGVALVFSWLAPIIERHLIFNRSGKSLRRQPNSGFLIGSFLSTLPTVVGFAPGTCARLSHGPPSSTSTATVETWVCSTRFFNFSTGSIYKYWPLTTAAMV